MKTKKEASIVVRVTKEMKADILTYCGKHNINVSEFVRIACEKIFAANN